jgi:hypothetical protein
MCVGRNGKLLHSVLGRYLGFSEMTFHLVRRRFTRAVGRAKLNSMVLSLIWSLVHDVGRYLTILELQYT